MTKSPLLNVFLLDSYKVFYGFTDILHPAINVAYLA